MSNFPSPVRESSPRYTLGLNEWNFIQKNTESNITNCKSKQNNIISYIITSEKGNSLYYLVIT